MLRKMVSLLPVESLVAISSKDLFEDELSVQKSLNLRNERNRKARKTTTMTSETKSSKRIEVPELKQNCQNL